MKKVRSPYCSNPGPRHISDSQSAWIFKYSLGNKADSAICFYKKALFYNKTTKGLYLMLIIALYERKDNNQADTYYTKVKEMFPGDLQTPLGIGNLQASLHLNGRAAESYTLAASICHEPTMKASLIHEADSLALRQMPVGKIKLPLKSLK